MISEDNKEFNCIRNALHAEARSEPDEGIRAVMSVIYNRKNHKDYPNSFCGVILQPKQFSAFNNDRSLATKRLKPTGLQDRLAYAKMSWVASEVLLGTFKPTLDRDVLHYASIKVKNKWTQRYRRVIVLSRHAFYKEI